MEKYGSVLVCNLAALTRVVGRNGASNSWVAKKDDLQDAQSSKSQYQSNCLLRRERERKVRDSVREQRHVA